MLFGLAGSKNHASLEQRRMVLLLRSYYKEYVRWQFVSRDVTTTLCRSHAHKNSIIREQGFLHAQELNVRAWNV